MRCGRILLIGLIYAALHLFSAGNSSAQEVRPPLAPRFDPQVQPATHVQPAAAPTPAGTLNNSPLPIAPRGVKNPPTATEAGMARDSNTRSFARPAGSWSTTFISLGVVLALFLGSMWLIKRAMPAPPPRLPAEVVEVLGCAPLTGRQSAHLVRIGNKLLLVSMFPSGAETLTEITDPVEVDRIAGLCRAHQPQSTTASFRSLIDQFGRERTAPGFVPPVGPAAMVRAAVDSIHDHPEDDDV